MPSTVSASHDRLEEPLLREEWAAVTGAPHLHILLVGDAAATSAAVSALQPVRRSPCVTWKCGHTPLVLPPSEAVRTLILNGVAALSLNEQQLLSDWIAREGGHTQIISTSEVPLFPLIKSGAFLEMLYYRLNLIYSEVPRSENIGC